MVTIKQRESDARGEYYMGIMAATYASVLTNKYNTEQTLDKQIGTEQTQYVHNYRSSI